MLQALLEPVSTSHREIEQIPMFSSWWQTAPQTAPMEEGGCIPPEPRGNSGIPAAGETRRVTHGGRDGPN
jgi:hypothetical protein